MSQHPKAKLSNAGLDFTHTIHNDTYDFIKPEQFDLKGRAVLVTGASKGIGKETAISYAKAGASHIAIAARTSLNDVEAAILKAAEAAGKAKPQVLQIQLDVTSEDSVSKAADKIKESFARIDILINNAGFLEGFVRLHESDPKRWWRSWEVNIKGVYLVSRALIPLLLESKDGLRTVLNVSSIGANVITAGASAYQTNKLALLRLTEHMNNDYQQEGLLSFGVHPGGVLTELASGMPEAMHSLLIDTPILAADTFVWLTAERREWLRGRYVSVTWDMPQLLDKRPKIEAEDMLKVRLDVGFD